MEGDQEMRELLIAPREEEAAGGNEVPSSPRAAPQLRARLQARLGRMGAAVARKWLVVYPDGSSSLVTAHKLATTHALGVHARDLRLLDPQLAGSFPPAILARPSAIVVNLETVKLVLTEERAFLTNLDDPSVAALAEELCRRLAALVGAEELGGAAQEPELLEAGSPGGAWGWVPAPERQEGRRGPAGEAGAEAGAAAAAQQATAADTQQQQQQAEQQELGGSPPPAAWEPLAASAGHGSVLSCGTTVSLGRSRGSSASSEWEDAAVEVVEALLQSFFFSMDQTWNRLRTLTENIDDTEDYINIQLDNKRNQLIGVDLVLTSVNAGSALIIAVTALFAMNMKQSPDWVPGEITGEVQTQGPYWSFVVIDVTLGLGAIALVASVFVYARMKGLLNLGGA